MIDDRAKRVEHTIWTELLAELVPENLRRIEFRQIGGKADQLNIVWHDQPLGPMGGRPIENHDDITVRVSLSHLTQKCSHEVGIHGVGDHPVQSSLLRAKGGIDIAEPPDKGFQDRGTEGPVSPVWIYLIFSIMAPTTSCVFTPPPSSIPRAPF